MGAASSVPAAVPMASPVKPKPSETISQSHSSARQINARQPPARCTERGYTPNSSQRSGAQPAAANARTAEKSVISNETVFSDDGLHRLLLHKQWDNEKPSAMIIMINPNSADNLSMDMTTMLVVNNLNRLDFGSVDIVNLYTRITPKIHFRFYSDEDLLHPDNDTMILESAEKADKIIEIVAYLLKNA